MYWLRRSVLDGGAALIGGTWHLASEGKSSTIDDMKPGDIIGTSNDHVIMFLAYKGDNVVYIQESGGEGNVNVAESKKEWLDKRYVYKRNLDGWYGDGG